MTKHPLTRWILKIKTPIEIGMSFCGLDRQEVVDTIIVETTGSRIDRDDRQFKALLSVYGDIAWERSDDISFVDFETCDVEAAIQRAYADARSRGEIWCVEQAERNERKIDGSHSATVHYMRGVRAKEGAA